MTTAAAPFRIDERSRVRFEARLQAALEIAFHRLGERVMTAAAVHFELPDAFWEREEEILVSALTSLWHDGLLLGVEAEQAHFLAQGVVVNFQPHAHRAAAQLAQETARQIIDNLTGRVDEMVRAWSEGDEAPERLGEQLRTGPLSQTCAELIAVTETTRAIAAGQLLVWRALRPPAKSAPLVTPPNAPAFVVSKRWRVRRDEQVCPICEPLNGSVVGLDEKFERPDMNLRVDAPPAHPRCRCYLEPVWSNEPLQAQLPPVEDDPCAQYPGWTTYTDTYAGFSGCINLQTLAPVDQMRDPNNSAFAAPVVRLEELAAWWSSLTPTEQEIEYALANTEGDAGFDHIPEHTFEFVTSWIEANRTTIERIATEFEVDPALVAGILASEMLYDYSILDQQADSFIIGPQGQGTGYASAHTATLILAYEHLVEQYPQGDNPWDANPNAPEIDLATDTVNGDLRRFTVGTEGTITAAAMVARWLVDLYTADPAAGHDPTNLSAEDMAIIWAAYRSGIGGITPPAEEYGYRDLPDFQTRLAREGLGPNAQLALPVMEYLIEEMFNGEE